VANLSILKKRKLNNQFGVLPVLSGTYA